MPFKLDDSQRRRCQKRSKMFHAKHPHARRRHWRIRRIDYHKRYLSSSYYYSFSSPSSSSLSFLLLLLLLLLLLIFLLAAPTQLSSIQLCHELYLFCSDGSHVSVDTVRPYLLRSYFFFSQVVVPYPEYFYSCKR